MRYYTLEEEAKIEADHRFGYNKRNLEWQDCYKRKLFQLKKKQELQIKSKELQNIYY